MNIDNEDDGDNDDNDDEEDHNEAIIREKLREHYKQANKIDTNTNNTDP